MNYRSIRPWWNIEHSKKLFDCRQNATFVNILANLWSNWNCGDRTAWQYLFGCWASGYIGSALCQELRSYFTRLGEKLYEELFHETEDYMGTKHPKILLTESKKMDWEGFFDFRNRLHYTWWLVKWIPQVKLQWWDVSFN